MYIYKYQSIQGAGVAFVRGPNKKFVLEQAWVNKPKDKQV